MVPSRCCQCGNKEKLALNCIVSILARVVGYDVDVSRYCVLGSVPGELPIRQAQTFYFVRRRLCPLFNICVPRPLAATSANIRVD